MQIQWLLFNWLKKLGKNEIFLFTYYRALRLEMLAKDDNLSSSLFVESSKQ